MLLSQLFSMCFSYCAGTTVQCRFMMPQPQRLANWLAWALGEIKRTGCFARLAWGFSQTSYAQWAGVRFDVQ